MQAEREFHKSRFAFMIINDKLLFLANSPLSHKEWFETLKTDADFDKVNRGYYKDGKIIVYKADFTFDNETIQVAQTYYKAICKRANSAQAELWCGVNKGKIGENWLPIKRLI